jgi:hypothetical protein
VRCSRQNFILPQGQTWGGNWSGEISDEDHPFGSDDQGSTYSWADVLRAATDTNRLRDILDSCEESAGWGWGPKHQGEWVVTLETYRQYLHGETYIYRPMFDAIPGEAPEPPEPPVPPSSEHPPITGSIRVEEHDGRNVIRGMPVLTIPENQPPGDYKYVITPEDDEDRFSFEPFYL